MSTSFDKIYCLNSLIKDDYRFLNKPRNYIYSMSFNYLVYAISYFQMDCYKDLSNYTPFSQVEYEYTSDGISNEYLLSSTPITNSEFYVGYRENDDYDYTEIIDYTYDENTNIITINSPTIPENYEVYVSAYVIGEFADDLNELEKVILSNGMLVPYTQGNINKETLLNHMIYGGSSKIYSQANHIQKVKDVSNNQYFNVVKSMIYEYSYRYNPNRNKGLGGGLV